MTVSPLIPAAGAAAGALAVKAAKSLAGGLSFADMFRRADQAQPAVSRPAVEAQKSPQAPSASDDPRQLLSEFTDLVRRKLAAAGIDTLQPIELCALGQDGVKVNGDHPDWPRIEQLFADDPAFRDAFHRIAGAFARQNPIDGRRFQLTLAGDQATVSFE